MDFVQFNDTYILKLEQHEEFFREVKKFCIENKIEQAELSAIGAINSVTLGFFNTQTKDYQEQSFHKGFELTSAQGTIQTVNNELVIHVHATVSDKDFRSYGGHLFRAIVSKVVEVVIRKI